jgi:hypothetical protein
MENSETGGPGTSRRVRGSASIGTAISFVPDSM